MLIYETSVSLKVEIQRGRTYFERFSTIRLRRYVQSVLGLVCTPHLQSEHPMSQWPRQPVYSGGINDINNMENEVGFGTVLFHNCFGLFKCLSCAPEYVNRAGTSLSIRQGNLASNPLASACDNNGLTSLRELRFLWVDRVVGVVVPFGDWSGVWWLHRDSGDFEAFKKLNK
jgi:hypothetical protein